MKSILIGLLTILFPLACLCQNKKDDAILIPAQGVTSQKIKAALLSSGFGIENSDSTYIMSTATQANRSPTMKVSVFKKDSVYLIQGWLNMDYELYGVKSSFEVIKYQGMKGSASRLAWDRMNTFALKLSDSLIYIKQ